MQQKYHAALHNGHKLVMKLTSVPQIKNFTILDLEMLNKGDGGQSKLSPLLEAPDVQSTQNMSRGQLEKLAAEDAED